MRSMRGPLVGLAMAAALFVSGCRGGLTVAPNLALRGPATVTGRVTAAGSHAPVPGALVVIEGAGALQAVRTGPDGRYAVRVVWERSEETASGTAPLQTRVIADGYQDESGRVSVSPGAAHGDFALVPAL